MISEVQQQLIRNQMKRIAGMTNQDYRSWRMRLRWLIARKRAHELTQPEAEEFEPFISLHEQLSIAKHTELLSMVRDWRYKVQGGKQSAEARREYQRNYMRSYRQRQRDLKRKLFNE